MIANPKIKVNFYLTNKKPIGTPRPIRCFISYNGDRTFIADVGIVKPKYWNDKIKRVKGVSTLEDKDEINDHLEDVSKWIIKEFKNQCKEFNSYPDHSKFKLDCIDLIKHKGIIPSIRNPEFTNLTDYLQDFISRCESGKRTVKGSGGKRKPMSEGTIKIYRTMLKNVKKFHELGYNIDFNRLSKEFFEAYKKFMEETLDYNENTLAKHIKTLKAIVNEARSEGLTDAEFTGKDFEAGGVKVDNIYLNEQELKRMQNLDLSDEPILDRARDLFLLGANSALRFGDWLELDPRKLQDDIIEVDTKKTGISVAIPINETIKSIFKKYEGTATRLPLGMSNPEINRHIKVVGRLAKIDELIPTKIKKDGLRLVIDRPKYESITSHTARRSGATNMYKEGIPSLAIMAITGHTTEANFLKYIKATNKEHAQRILDLRNNKRQLRIISGGE